MIQYRMNCSLKVFIHRLKLSSHYSKYFNFNLFMRSHCLMHKTHLVCLQIYHSSWFHFYLISYFISNEILRFSLNRLIGLTVATVPVFSIFFHTSTFPLLFSDLSDYLFFVWMIHLGFKVYYCLLYIKKIFHHYFYI